MYTSDDFYKQLQSIYSDGIPMITLNSNAGLVGYAFHKRETVVENNVSSSKYFFKEFDKKSGYKTQVILAVPIINANKKTWCRTTSK